VLLRPKVPEGLRGHARGGSEHFGAPPVPAHGSVFRGPHGESGQRHPDTDIRSGNRLPFPVLADLHLDRRNRHHCHGEADPVPVHHVREQVIRIKR